MRPAAEELEGPWDYESVTHDLWGTFSTVSVVQGWWLRKFVQPALQMFKNMISKWITSLFAMVFIVQASSNQEKDAFLDSLVNEMAIPELVMQLHLMFADNVVGPMSKNELYDFAMQSAPTAGIGVIHDWYPTDPEYYNTLQKLNRHKSRLGIPFMQLGECVHGVGSFKQSMFPQAIGMGTSFDRQMVYRVGRAIGEEARAIGIHACLAPVLDLGKEPRWGRVQEDWGEDFVLTSHMGVAFASGLSKNGSWSDPDAVVPVMKHFAAHGSPHGGINAASFMGHGMRQVMMEMLVPFKAIFDLGGARGVMMAYHELDEIPSHVHPLLYDALEEWGFDGFIMADDTGMIMLNIRHTVSNSPADTIQQWFNAGGNLQFYDYDLPTYLNCTIDLIKNGTVAESTLRSHARRILSVKYDLGLFNDPYIPKGLDYRTLTADHVSLTLDAARRSIVLLENKNATLPIKPAEQGISKIALIGPFSDILNYGDYSGSWGEYPVANSSTIRQAMTGYLSANVSLVSSWGADTWMYTAQHAIPGYHLSVNGTSGGLLATYYSDTNFTHAVFQVQEQPNRDWGLYPPLGLPSNNFSAVWEGELEVPVDGSDVEGYIGVAVYANNTGRVYVDDVLVAQSEFSDTGTVMGDIQSLSYVQVNATSTPPGGAPFTWKAGARHKLRVEFQAWNLWQKVENVNSINAQVDLFWNLVDREDAVGKAVDIACEADLVVLAVGASWSSDGENGDRATLELSVNQTKLADAIFALGKPVVLLLEGGRPFAIPEYYSKSAAAINAFFPGQSGGQAIADVLFGEFNPGGRVPLSVPYDVAQLPVYYNYKFTDHAINYTDLYSFPTYSFGYGLSYTTFSVQNFNSTSTGGVRTFAPGETITFRVEVTNEGNIAGSYVAQVYLLVRVSTIVRPRKQLVAFDRVYLDAGQTKVATMELEVDRYLRIVNRRYEWELERGEYVFALLEHGGPDANTMTNVTMLCLG
ncbi:glycoside hydrolase family 3 protein [Guyanagaster necrorhizus]|uniref:xylan 1,4-beta-xylosidase n=1 Tax=Guyanagaster necrorhizus TaxID=856835 RepID=A0A9P7VFE5_9AGAR|nr:glycoside hydrolase family 3 protein [Guyanagaster necrorhizus MCA 3950]KAG7439704.1 glycoside hydrolase family 3 protein [Guyanagaster necrorhizus MCA 3950]